MIKKRNLPSSLYKRQVIYNWLQTNRLPGLRGMLYDLSRNNKN
jgi:hypothetical protein